jgi:integrase
MSARHVIAGAKIGAKIQLYKRGGRYWQCAASVGGRQYRASTHREELAQAQDVAEDWFLELRGKFKRGEGGHIVMANAEKTFAHAAEHFMREFRVLTEGQRSPIYVGAHERRLRRYLTPFFGEKPLSEVTSGLIQEYRIDRLEKAKAARGKIPARSTIHQEMVVLRQVLKTALRHGWLRSLPDMSQPYRANGKITHRAWFSLEEYRQLYKATQRRAKHPPRADFKHENEQLHDMVLFMANTGLRPDEALRLEYRDVSIVDDDGSGETILEIEVRGKRGVGYCKSTANAVPVFQRMRKRNKPVPTDRLFPKYHHQMFNSVLNEQGLKFDREGQARTFYSLRHTYICFRLMEGADIYQIAKNCRTSVEMIEKYYASHIKNVLDASAINVRREKPAKKVEDIQKKIVDVRRGELAG